MNRQIMAKTLTRTEFAEMVLNNELAREYIYAGKDTYETAEYLQHMAFTYPQKYTVEYGTKVHHYRDFYRLLEEFGCPPIFAEEVNYMAKQDLEESLNHGSFNIVDEDKLLIMSTRAACCADKTDTDVEDEISKRTILHCYGVNTARYRIGISTCCEIISNTWYETPENRYTCTCHCNHPPGLYPC